MVVGQSVACEIIMLAEMSTITDEKPFVDDEASVATAQALASEALRLAEEAKKAAQRLAEVRATLLYLKQLNSPKEQPLIVDTSIVEEKKEAEVVVEAPVSDVAANEIHVPHEERDAAADVEEAPEVVTPIERASSPTNSVASPASPVSILKNAASKSGPKEVRYAPDTVDPVSSPSKVAPLTEAPSEDDLIVKLYDAVGIDKICGIDFSAQEGEQVSVPIKQSLVPPEVLQEVDPFEENTMSVEEEITVEEPKRGNTVEEPKEESTTTVTIDSQAKSEPVEEPPVPEDEVAASAPAVEPEVEVPAPVSSPTEVVAEESTDQQVAKVDPPTSTGEVAHAEATVPTEAVVEEKQDETATPVKEPAEPKGAKPLTVDTTMTKETKVFESPRRMTPLMKQALARQRTPVLSKPDPFGGEHDDMDFIPCGSGDPSCVDGDDEDLSKLSSPRMLCGWGV